MDKIDILSLDLPQLQTVLNSLGEKKFRAKQIFEWLHVKKSVSFGEMSNLPLTLRTKLDDTFYINSLNISRKLESCVDNIVKYLYRLSDGNFVESVVMEYKHGLSLCLSTQVGCKMGCKFCASTIAGFVRNLTSSEMLLQLYETERDLNKTISSIVLMGIGEPLDNFDNVMSFLSVLSSEYGRNMSLRHVTISTCGIVPRILQLANLKTGLTLSVSLHASSDYVRNEIMPVNKTYNINELIDACRYYIDKTGRRVTFEYAVIDDVNASPYEADKLSKLIKGLNCHVNLIPVNPIKERNYKTLRHTVQNFKKYLEKNGVNVTVRRTLGSDINAACGQLRRNEINVKEVEY